MINGIIYDMDDLMINSHPLHTKAQDEQLKKYNVSMDDYPPELVSHFIGRRVIDVMKELKEYFKIQTDLDTLYKERQEIFLEIVKKELEPMPGLRQSLDLFKSLHLKIAIASSGATKYIDIVLGKFNIQTYFDVIITGDDVHKGKPDPEVYIVAVQKLQLKPEECLVLEDAHAGIIAAKGAGCKCIGIQSPHTPTQDLSLADMRLNSLEEMTKEIVASLA